MLEKLLNHSNLGTSDQVKQILELLEVNSYSKVDLKFACSKIDYEINRAFDGIITLLSWLEIIEVSEVITRNNKVKFKDINYDISLLIVNKLSDEGQLHNLINAKNLIYDKFYIVKKSGIDIGFSQFRNILKSLGFFEKDYLIENNLIIGSSFTNWIATQGINYIETSKKKSFSLKALKSKQNQQEIAGFRAEKFVLEYELRLRKNHPTSNKIKIISEENAGAGYDIKSYKDDKSIILDKFIEVKSYSSERLESNKPYFFWSSNEADVASQEKNNYYLYIVDSENIDNNLYEPIVIRNPYDEIFNSNKWAMAPQNWLFTLN
jgi:hypothetical protein